MTRIFVPIAATLMLVLVGCGGKENVAEKDNSKFVVEGPKTLELAQGRKAKQFTIAINRDVIDKEKWKASIDVTVKSVPEGLKVTDIQGKGQWKSTQKDNEHIFQIDVDPQAKLHDTADLVFEATSKGVKAVKTIEIKILESLENKMEKKKIFTKEHNEHVEKIEKAIADITKKVPSVEKDDIRESLLKRLGEFTGDFKDAKKAFRKLRESQAKNWEQYREGFATRVESLQRELADMRKALKQALEKSSKSQ